MYKTFSLITLLFFSIACNNAQTQQEVKSVQAVSNTPATPEKTKPAPRQNMVISTARSKADIQTDFPFDIDLKTADGKLINSSEVMKKNGKPTVVLFWLTTCIPCRIELEAIRRVYDEYARDGDFNMVAISTDFSKNFDRFVERVNESGWGWQAYNDVNREFRLVMPGELNGLPQSFIFDKDGQIVYHKRKYSSGDEIILLEKAKALAMK